MLIGTGHQTAVSIDFLAWSDVALRLRTREASAAHLCSTEDNATAQMARTGNLRAQRPASYQSAVGLLIIPPMTSAASRSDCSRKCA